MKLRFLRVACSIVIEGFLVAFRSDNRFLTSNQSEKLLEVFGQSERFYQVPEGLSVACDRMAGLDYRSDSSFSRTFCLSMRSLSRIVGAFDESRTSRYKGQSLRLFWAT